MRFWKGFFGFIAGLALLWILFVSAFEMACYSDYHFYEKEYEKYQVNQGNILNMSMDELMKVTKEMMDYLHGNRDDLVVYAQIDGTEKLVFNQIDQSHMADVRELFLEGLYKRFLCTLIVLCCMGVLLGICGKREMVMALCKGIRWSFAAFLIFLSGFAVIAVLRFERVFYAIHLLLFDNDNWLLDPSISRLINMLPEGFFMDMGLRIGFIFIFYIFFILFLSFLIKRGMIERNKKISGGTYE